MKTLTFDLGSSWNKVLSKELRKDYIRGIKHFVEDEWERGVCVYPPEPMIFNALKTTPYEEVKVVIVGQDPYHGPGQAHGLSFSVLPGVKLPPSLKNIYKELSDDLNVPVPKDGCLTSWAQQGVLLLNTTLTVRQGDPMSHSGIGWERFTDAVIEKLCEREDPLIFVLWGRHAQKKYNHIREHHSETNHHVIVSAHPSPFSARRGFFGSRPFSKINSLLEKQIKWSYY